MALVRVYCGLASAELRPRPATTNAWLTVAVVDDAGRLLDVCDVSDDAAGYAHLGGLLAERSGGPTGVCIAADSDDHLVTMLLTAAGRPLVFADDDSVDDFAERFADDESIEEIESPAAVRRAIGLARALQAGVISAVAVPAPRDLAALKPVLAAHSAIAVGRHAAAVALREVLRELYPAALRAYPDPAEQVCLAVLDALPEPGLVCAPTSGRDRHNGQALDAVAGRLAAAGAADGATVTEAITALRVAVSETPPRVGLSNAVTATVAETVRQTVAAVRAFDAASNTLIGTLAERENPPTSRPQLNRLTVARSDDQAPDRASARGPEPGQIRVPVPVPRRPRPVSPAAGPVSAAPFPARPVSAEPMPARPVSAEPMPVRPVSAEPMPARPLFGTPMPAYPPDAPAPTAPPSRAPAAAAPVSSAPVSSAPVSSAPVSGWPVSAAPMSGAPTSAAPAATAFGSGGLVPVAPLPTAPAAEHGAAPVPPPPPPGITPIPRRPVTPTSPRWGPERPAHEPMPRRPWAQPTPLPTPSSTPAPAPAAGPTPMPVPTSVSGPPAARPTRTAGFGITDYSPPTLAQRPAYDEPRWRNGDVGPVTEPAPPGSRANWPLVGPYDEPGASPVGLEPPPERREGRVKPPWQSDDMPPEPPMLRLVEPPPLADPALRDPFTDDIGGHLPTDVRLDPPPLRLVEGEGAGRSVSRSRRNGVADRSPEPPVSGSSDDNDLLIFAAAKSAWFTGREETDVPTWESSADFGWQAAEQLAEPVIGDLNYAGLPRRVPQENLVPGSPAAAPERPLRIVRDPGSIAEHTAGYFQGWRRGREIGGYAVGGRPGRDSAHGWDFSRDHGNEYDLPEYEYPQAAYRS